MTLDWKQIGTGVITGVIIGTLLAWASMFYLHGQDIATLKLRTNTIESGLPQLKGKVDSLSTSLSGWKLLYEHDNNGLKISGSIEELVEAITKAYPIKIRVLEGSNSSHIFDAQWLWVEDQEVLAQNTSQIRAVSDDTAPLEHIPKFSLSVTNDKTAGYARQVIVDVSTKGLYQVRLRHTGGIQWISDHLESLPTFRRRMAWYGLVPP